MRRTLHSAMRRAARAGFTVMQGVLGLGIRRLLTDPKLDKVPEGGILDLAGRGRTFVVDVPGPTEFAPTIVLLHAMGARRTCPGSPRWPSSRAPTAS